MGKLDSKNHICHLRKNVFACLLFNIHNIISLGLYRRNLGQKFGFWVIISTYDGRDLKSQVGHGNSLYKNCSNESKAKQYKRKKNDFDCFSLLVPYSNNICILIFHGIYSPLLPGEGGVLKFFFASCSYRLGKFQIS